MVSAWLFGVWLEFFPWALYNGEWADQWLSVREATALQSQRDVSQSLATVEAAEQTEALDPVSRSPFPLVSIPSFHSQTEKHQPPSHRLHLIKSPLSEPWGTRFSQPSAGHEDRSSVPST